MVIVGFKLPCCREPLPFLTDQASQIATSRAPGARREFAAEAPLPDRRCKADFTGVCWWEGDLATGISRYMATGGHDHIKRSQADLSGVIRLKRVDNLPES
jgi:hypothetical protein